MSIRNSSVARSTCSEDLFSKFVIFPLPELSSHLRFVEPLVGRCAMNGRV